MAHAPTSKTLLLILAQLAVIMLLNLTSCNWLQRDKSGDSNIKNEIMNQIISSSNNDCDVMVTLKAVGEVKLNCSIQIKNKTKFKLYFFNQIYMDISKEGIFQIDTNNFYTYIENEEKLLIVKGIIPVPANLKVEKKIIPCCSKILPGEMFEELVEINLPIRLYAPYIKIPEKIKKQYPVIFRFGYFVGHDQTESMEIRVGSNKGELICFDPFDYNFQKIIEVGMFKPMNVNQ